MTVDPFDSIRVHRCPQCDGIAKPVNLKSEPGAVVMSFRCSYCHHTWDVKQQGHPKVLKPQSD